MGEVYRALDTQLRRTVAIKVLSALNGADSGIQRRFVQSSAQSNNDHLPDGGDQYEYLAGGVS